MHVWSFSQIVKEKQIAFPVTKAQNAGVQLIRVSMSLFIKLYL
jgi:hypothetical protein